MEGTQANFFGKVVEPINRDRGPGWITYTGSVSHYWIGQQFIKRFGFEPAEIYQEGFYTFIGPTPDQEFEFDQDEDEED